MTNITITNLTVDGLSELSAVDQTSISGGKRYLREDGTPFPRTPVLLDEPIKITTDAGTITFNEVYFL